MSLCSLRKLKALLVITATCYLIYLKTVLVYLYPGLLLVCPYPKWQTNQCILGQRHYEMKRSEDVEW